MPLAGEYHVRQLEISMKISLAGSLALSLLFPCSASAQLLGSRVTAAGGMDAVLYDGPKYVPGYVGQLGLEWRPGTSRGAFRLGLMHYQQNRNNRIDFYSPCTGPSDIECTEIREYGATGLSADGSFDLGKGRIRPYLLSGVGAFRSTMNSRVNYRCTGLCFDIGYPSHAYSRRAWSGSMHSGFGLSANAGRTTLFTEFRVMLLATDGSRSRGMMPVIFGVKF